MVDTPEPKDRPSAGAEPQPWHAADEKKKPAGGGAPIGTHSLTGGGANVGMPDKPAAEGEPERGDAAHGERAADPDPLAEPRANIGELLGRKP